MNDSDDAPFLHDQNHATKICTAAKLTAKNFLSFHCGLHKTILEKNISAARCMSFLTDD